MSVVQNISKRMSRLLSPDIMSLLKRIGALASPLDSSAFIVGGLVRDVLLGTRNLDLDVVVEGDAIGLGRLLAGKLNASVVVHKRFGTCSVITKEKLKIDLATARKEIYETPAALPTVEFSRLKDDLIRRDFTINAMAASLSPGNFGQLADFFDSQRDLERGRIRVMHDGSFIDDPTRIFRAVRFEQRFGFAIDNHTEGLIRNAIDKEMFEKVDPQRIRDELILILKEDDPLRVLSRMAELDELRFIHPKVRLDSRTRRLCAAVEEARERYETARFRKRSIDRWLLYLMALFGNLSYNDVSRICAKFVFRRGETLRILSYKKMSKTVAGILSSRGALRPSRIYRLLEPLSFEVILMIGAASGSSIVKARIRDFFTKYNGVKTSIKGSDLKAMGLRPSPEFTKILKKVLYARIDGVVKTRSEELAYAAKSVRI